MAAPTQPNPSSSPHDGQGASRVDQARMDVSVGFPPELVEAIAQRAAEIVAERQAGADDGWLRGADAIADYIGARRDRVYALSSARRIPVHRDGATLLAKRSELDQWIRDGGGVRP